MSFQCYSSRASLRSALVGAMFVLAGGAKRVIPDQWLVQAELLENGRLLRLSYTFCTIEVAGQNLDPVFEDASVGKLGAIQAAPPQGVPAGQPCVTSIIVIDAGAQTASEFEEGCSDA
ncbi:MAG TPA: hypothetical protein VE398_24495 [Acidobacteriota bacterium]|nr:hypothetical protein [Acidobacteriota bacterium]